MDLDKLRKALGLADDATEDMILSSVGQLALSAPRADQIILSRAEVEDLRAQAKQGEQAAETLRLSQRDSAIDGAVREGRLAPVAVDQFKALWDVNPEATAVALSALPVIEQFKREAVDATDAPGAEDSEAPIGARIETRAQALMAADKTLTLAVAYERADSEIRPRAGKAA